MDESKSAETNPVAEIKNEQSNIAGGSGTSAESVFQDYNPADSIKRGRGRHPNVCTCEKCLAKKQVASQTVDSTANRQDNNPPVDATFIARSVKTLASVVDKVLAAKIEKLSNAIIEDKNYTAKLVEEVKATEEELTLISELSAKLCEKYNVLGEYSLEAVLFVSVVGYGTRYAIAISDLKKIALHKVSVAEKQ